MYHYVADSRYIHHWVCELVIIFMLSFFFRYHFYVIIFFRYHFYVIIFFRYHFMLSYFFRYHFYVIIFFPLAFLCYHFLSSFLIHENVTHSSWPRATTGERGPLCLPTWTDLHDILLLFCSQRSWSQIKWQRYRWVGIWPTTEIKIM